MRFGVPVGKIEFSKPKENKKDVFYRVENFEEKLKTVQENKEKTAEEQNQDKEDLNR